MNLLIVDDERISVKCMEMQVDWQACGADRVFTAFGAEEGKEIINREHIDLLLCDIEMPGESGLDFLRWVRSKGLEIPCIFLTCHAKFDYAKEAIELGCQDYILKPAAYDVITQKIKGATEKIQRDMEAKQAQTMGQQWLREQADSLEEKKFQHDSPAKLCKEIKEYIIANLGNENLSVGGIAEAFFLNRDYVNRVFTKEEGTPLRQYIIQQRMELAGKLLQESQALTADVAERVGYSDMSYFVKSFKKYYGQTPMQYRSNDKII